jgi:hypothetical protein
MLTAAMLNIVVLSVVILSGSVLSIGLFAHYLPHCSLVCLFHYNDFLDNIIVVFKAEMHFMTFREFSTSGSIRSFFSKTFFYFFKNQSSAKLICNYE